MSFFLLVAATLLRLQLVLAAPVERCDHNLTVDTANGPIIGHYATCATSVIEFLGIPYAKPPVGQLRWAAPEKYISSQAYKAKDWGYDCPYQVAKATDYPGLTTQAHRIIADFTAGVNHTQSEDFLTLNIWTRQTGTVSNKPVVVFFYGGRFAVGTTHSPFFDGQYLVNNTELILVTVNDRTNIFGFPGAPGLPQQNVGFMDQRSAVEWVRDNIVAFGGDPSRITIMGQSAGAVAVDYWSYTYIDDPIAVGMISHSGNVFSFGINDANVSARNWYNVSETLGCGSSGDTIDCLRTKNWTDVKRAADRISAGLSNSPLRTTPSFNPVVDNMTVFADYHTRSQNGEFAKIPYLLGNNDFEQGLYKISAFAAGHNTTEAQGDAFLLSSFTCPNALEARARAKAGVPVWQFRYFGDWDNLILYNSSTFNPGGSQAYHGVDLNMIFGASEDVSGLPTTESERRVTRWMQKAWESFAADPANGLDSVDWPRFSESNATIAVIAKGNSPEVQYMMPQVYNAACKGVQVAGGMPQD